MTRKAVLNILLTNVADSDAEQLIAGFRRAGEIIQFERIQKAEELEAALSSQTWDLLVYADTDATPENHITVQQCGHSLRKKNADTAIFFIGEADPLDSPDPSISQVFAQFSIPELIHDALKERAFRKLQHDLLQSQALLCDAERRSQLLLSESSDAIAYITDGMIVHTNEQFCEQLGLTDIEGLSVLDLVIENDINRLKTALKQSAQNEREYPIDLHFSDDDEGEALHYKALLSSAIFEEEPCIQLRIESATSGSGNPLADIASSNIQNFSHVLHEFLETERNTDSSLVVIGIDEFSLLRAQNGINRTENLAIALAAQMKSTLPGSHFGRLADDIFAVIAHNTGSDEALKNCQSFIEKIAQRDFEIQQKSIHCTISAVTLPINHLTPHDTSMLIEIGFHTLQKLMDAGGNQAELYRRDHQHLSKEGNIGNIIDEAIGNKRLHLLFEPLMGLSNNSANHYEVAPHMKNASADEISGAEIMRLIEDEPSNHKFDRWIVLEATRQLSLQHQQGDELKLIINLSGNVFHDAEFCTWLGVAINAAGITMDALILQFSEQSIENSMRQAQETSKQLKSLGGHISVREFSRTDNTDKLLEGIAPCMVKPGFRSDDSPNNATLLELIQHARKLSSRICIPNVNSAATLAMLWQLSPDFIQGEYIREPSQNMDYKFSDM